MENKKWYQIFGGYLRQYRMAGLLFFIFTGIFAAVFWLYDLKTEAVWYAFGLCLFLAAVILPVHFVLYWRKHRQLWRINDNAQLLLKELPKPDSPTEEAYQEILLSLKQTFDDSMNQWQNEKRDSVDYYTAWVHQIKTPIAVMRMALSGEDTDEYRELSYELFRIEQYVEMVLGYIRLESRNSDFVFKEYDLDMIIRQAIRKYASQFVRKRLRLSYEPVTVSALTDEKWLLFILEQILSNAVKYTYQGNVSITVTEDKILRITDTGIGIAPEDLPRIFEKGFTGYNGRADKKSTGLGLYLCKKTADKLNYKISVTSKPGVGTTVSLDLRTEKLQAE